MSFRQYVTQTHVPPERIWPKPELNHLFEAITCTTEELYFAGFTTDPPWRVLIMSIRSLHNV